VAVLPMIDIEKIRRLLERRCATEIADEVRLELTVSGEAPLGP